MTTREIDDLFAQALSGEQEDDYDDDASWQAIRALRGIGTRQVFERAAGLCKSTDPLHRARGADVLGQLGKTAEHPRNAFPEESYAVVAELVQRERDPQALASGIAALGHLDNPLAVPLIASFSSHPVPQVRYYVAFALGCFPNDALSVQTLVTLTEDADEEIRDWATFALGVRGDVDSDEIREALIRRLADSNEDVREEAMVGLGKRKDQRVLPTLFMALERPDPTDRVIEAAYQMLGMEYEKKDWNAADYTAALHQRFSL